MQSTPIQDWQGLNIMIIGDIMIDRYLYGKIDRISPEAPIPIVDLDQNYDRLGGAANVALNIKSLGAIPFIFGAIGKDSDAFKLIELLESSLLDTSGIIHDQQRQTTVKTRIWASNKQILRVDQETKANLELKIEQKLWLNIESKINHSSIDAIVMQDYNKGVLTPFIIESTIRLANKKGIPIIVDPKIDNFLLYKNVTLFKPNLKEIRLQTDFEINPNNISDLKKATNFITSALGNSITMLTLSENGIYLEDARTHIICPTYKKNIIDVCGAGDTVLSIAALSVCINLSLSDIGILANLAGGQVCESIGVVPVDKDKLEREFIQHQKKSAHKN